MELTTEDINQHDESLIEQWKFWEGFSSELGNNKKQEFYMNYELMW